MGHERKGRTETAHLLQQEVEQVRTLGLVPTSAWVCLAGKPLAVPLRALEVAPAHPCLPGLRRKRAAVPELLGWRPRRHEFVEVAQVLLRALLLRQARHHCLPEKAPWPILVLAGANHRLRRGRGMRWRFPAQQLRPLPTFHVRDQVDGGGGGQRDRPGDRRVP